jgi:hypothetical protein
VPLTTIEGVVENGKIRLHEDVVLPEAARVFVIIADPQASPSAHIHTPRLADPRQAGDFRKKVIEVSDNAGL